MKSILFADKEFQNWVARNITILKAQNRQLQNTLDGILMQLGEKIGPNNPQPEKMKHAIPLNTTDDVENGRNIYISPENQESLVSGCTLLQLYIITVVVHWLYIICLIFMTTYV